MRAECLKKIVLLTKIINAKKKRKHINVKNEELFKSTLKSFQKEPNDNDKFDQYVNISRA